MSSASQSSADSLDRQSSKSIECRPDGAPQTYTYCGGSLWDNGTW